MTTSALFAGKKILTKTLIYICKSWLEKMSGDNGKLNQKWSIVKEQLISLCALNCLPRGNDGFRKFLSEELELKNLNSQNLNSICYYVLGIINCEERDRLIQWPLINIITNTKFRKGMLAMVNNFQEKYPWSHIRKLPESYFMNPHGNQARVIDFVSQLTNLAIHIALDDSDLLLMHSGEGLNSREIAIMTEIISKAKEKEEEVIRSYVLPLKEIEDAKNEICDKCIILKQENDDLQQQLSSLKKHAVSEQLVACGKNVDINELKEMRCEKFSELNAINEELSKYYDLSKELLLKVNTFKNPLSLSSKDFGCENSSVNDLTAATSKVCGDLCQFFQQITLKKSTKEEEDDVYEKLKILKKTIVAQNEALQSVLHNILLKQKA